MEISGCVVNVSEPSNLRREWKSITQRWIVVWGCYLNDCSPMPIKCRLLWQGQIWQSPTGTVIKCNYASDRVRSAITEDLSMVFDRIKADPCRKVRVQGEIVSECGVLKFGAHKRTRRPTVRMKKSRQIEQLTISIPTLSDEKVYLVTCFTLQITHKHLPYMCVIYLSVNISVQHVSAHSWPKVEKNSRNAWCMNMYSIRLTAFGKQRKFTLSNGNSARK